MGRVKALLPHPDGSGRTLIRAAAGTLLTAGLRPLFVVLGHARREIAPELRGLSGVEVVSNPAWASGMLSSVRAGVRAASRERAGWALVAPVDQPFVSVGLIHRLLARAAGEPTPVAVVPATERLERAGRWGLPALLGERLFPEVLEARGAPPDPETGPDPGARRLLARHRRELAVIRAEASELLDLDTPRDAAAAAAAAS